MKKPGSWMQQPTDDRILEILDTDLALKPAVIGFNVDRSRKTIQDRLRPLCSVGFVQKVDDAGYYVITEDGRAYLEGELDADDLEPE
ncbi:transcriptional regulator [Natrarchaeobaculum aegyptiacum]|uniref:Transcriptional regulator n=1 Tax=Natrarchaeobaculum aegyptiacum TaxID=745377 RepID=A0A2Z2HS77_9EURY|nr:transcriptional regulator [Natrarchaeobaculum aegyptiacum]ARS89942.1 transcriptional regulator [Natrarchaeobaculum aegyptiacum]